MVSPYITVMFCTDHISFVINKHNGIMSSVKYFLFDLLLELDISKLIWKWVWEGGIYIKSQWVIGSLSDVKANERMRKWGLSMFFSPSCQKGSQCYADRGWLTDVCCLHWCVGYKSRGETASERFKREFTDRRRSLNYYLYRYFIFLLILCTCCCCMKVCPDLFINT